MGPKMPQSCHQGVVLELEAGAVLYTSPGSKADMTGFRDYFDFVFF
jgi:hypothetical protein